MICGSIKEWILELLDGRLGGFWAEFFRGQLRAHLEPKACGALECFRKEDPIGSSFHLRLEVGYAPCIQGIRLHDWIIVGVSRALCEELTNIIGHVIDRLTIELRGRTLVVYTYDGWSG